MFIRKVIDDLLAFPPSVNEPCLFEQAQLMRDRGLCHAQRLSQIAHADVRLEEREPEIIPSVLSSNQCELAFLRDTPSLQYRYDTVPLYEEKILAIVSDKHPLAGQKGIQLHDLRNDQMIFLSTKSVLYGICMDLCLSAGFLPNVIFTGNRPENILDLVSRGMGTSLLTESFYNYYKKEHTIGIEIVPTAMTRMVLAHLKDHELSIPARRFWDYVASR